MTKDSSWYSIDAKETQTAGKKEPAHPSATCEQEHTQIKLNIKKSQDQGLDGLL